MSRRPDWWDWELWGIAWCLAPFLTGGVSRLVGGTAADYVSWARSTAVVALIVWAGGAVLGIWGDGDGRSGPPRAGG